MTCSETYRQFYLNAAGIRMWYARRPLPGAAPSPAYQPVDDIAWQEPADRGDTGTGLPAQSRLKEDSEPGVHRTVDLQALMAPTADAGKPEMPPPPARPDPAAVSAALSPDAEPGPEPVAEVPDSVGEPASRETIAAHLGIWPSESYLLISQWSDTAGERLQDSLATNLLRALRQGDIGQRQMLNWPVFRNPGIPGNSPEDFREVLSRLLSSYQAQSIILLGVLAIEPEERRQYCLGAVLERVCVDFPYALAEVSSKPHHKRELWAALRSRYRV